MAPADGGLPGRYREAADADRPRSLALAPRRPCRATRRRAARRQAPVDPPINIAICLSKVQPRDGTSHFATQLVRAGHAITLVAGMHSHPDELDHLPPGLEYVHTRPGRRDSVSRDLSRIDGCFGRPDSTSRSYVWACRPVTCPISHTDCRTPDRYVVVHGFGTYKSEALPGLDHRGLCRRREATGHGTRPRVFISYSHDSDEHRPNHMATLSVPDQEKVAKRTLHNLVRCSRTGGRGVRRRGQKRSVRRIGWMTRGLLWDGAPHRCVWRAGENDCGRFFEELL
jgi:hypothetical protein